MNCKNCSTKLGTSFNFCPECGAKIITKRITFKSIMHNISEQFFNYDNKILKTFIHLFSKPEAVIVGYIDGVRKRYINVLQYFAISLTITGLQFFILNTFFENPFNLDFSSFGISKAVPNPESIEKYFQSISEIMNKYYSLIYVLSIPISAIGFWLVYKLYQKKYNFSEHIIINTYYSAQLLIILAFLAIIFALFGVSYMDFSFYSMPFSFIYLWYVLKRVYQMSVFDSLAYIIIFFFAYAVLFVILGIASLIIGILIGLLLK